MPYGDGDIADDSAVWPNPTNPAASVVLADSKDESRGGIAVFDMAGNLLQYREDGEVGNVDVRSDFPLGNHSIVLVGANNRTKDTLLFWELDTASRRLSPPINAGEIETLSPNYGFCLYHSSRSNEYYAFVDQKGGGAVDQFLLRAREGKVSATRVRMFDVGSQTEGCVADDRTGYVYFGEEDVGVWRYSAEPDGGSERTQVDSVGGGHLDADVEGLSIVYGADGAGYLFVSSQGDSTVAVYSLSAGTRFVRSFRVVANGTIDESTDTDGVDVSSGNFGPGFESGVLVVHDGDNSDGKTSNLKYVPLEQIVNLVPTGTG